MNKINFTIDFSQKYLKAIFLAFIEKKMFPFISCNQCDTVRLMSVKTNVCSSIHFGFIKIMRAT